MSIVTRARIKTKTVFRPDRVVRKSGKYTAEQNIFCDLYIQESFKIKYNWDVW